MGLSSSGSTSNTTQNQQTNQTENATTTPVTPDWLTQAAQDYVGRIGAFGNMDPNSFVAPSSPLQNMAWQNAGSLSDWRGQAATASQMAQQAGMQGANYAGTGGQPQMAQMSSKFGGGPQPTSEFARPQQQNAFSGASSQQGGPAYTYNAPQLGNPGTPATYGAQQTSTGAAPQASASSYQAPQLSTPGLVSGSAYSAPQLGNASGYAAARTGAPIGATPYGYDATTIGTPSIAQTPGATASNADAGSIAGNIGQFQNPYQQDVVDSSLADFDHNAQVQQARLEAQGASAGAFGGSRFGIAQSNLLDDQGRARATLDSGIRAQGFDTAAGLAGQQAGYDQNTNLFNAQNQTGISQFNSGQDASRALSQAQLVQGSNLANQQAMDTAQQFTKGAANASQLQYATNANQNQLAQAGLDTDASKYAADMGNQYGLQQASLNANAGQYNATNAQQAALANQNLAGQFGLAQGQLNANAGQYNATNAQQTSLANQSLAGQYGLAQFGANTNAAQNYAQAQNAGSLAGYQGALSQSQLGAQLQAAAGQYNAGANNNMSQFNATQGDAAANRQLQAAGMLGGLANDYGAGTRADLATMGQLGDQQRSVEQAYAMAGPAQLQLMGQLSGMTPYDILVGRNVNGTTNGTMAGTGTQTTTQNPSLFSSLLQGASAVAPFIPSDRRLKRGIKKIGETANGLGLYLYRYLWEDRQRVGVMADEVARLAPGALGPQIHGFSTVDYGRLGLSHLVEA